MDQQEEEHEDNSNGNYYPIEFEGGGEECAWVLQTFTDLFLWTNPLFTLTWLILISLVNMLLVVYQYSILTLICYLLLVQLFLTKFALLLGPVVISDFDAHEFVQQRQAFSSDQLFRFSRGSADLISSAALHWNDTLLTRNAKKVLTVFSMLAVLVVSGLILSFEIAFALTTTLCFVSIRLVHHEWDRLLEWKTRVQIRVNESDFIQDRIMPFVQRILTRLEPVIGQFDD